jgi:hypothetical protein
MVARTRLRRTLRRAASNSCWVIRSPGFPFMPWSPRMAAWQRVLAGVRGLAACPEKLRRALHERRGRETLVATSLRVRSGPRITISEAPIRNPALFARSAVRRSRTPVRAGQPTTEMWSIVVHVLRCAKKPETAVPTKTIENAPQSNAAMRLRCDRAIQMPRDRGHCRSRRPIGRRVGVPLRHRAGAWQPLPLPSEVAAMREAVASAFRRAGLVALGLRVGLCRRAG